MALTVKDYAAYRKTARRRAKETSTRWAKRRERAWEVARRSAAFIKERHPSVRVRLFGSLLYPDSFHEKSDIDLAVEGLKWPDYLRIWSELDRRELDFVIDLVDVGIVSKGLRKHIEQEGVPV